MPGKIKMRKIALNLLLMSVLVLLSYAYCLAAIQNQAKFDGQKLGAVPLPPAESALQTIEAEPVTIAGKNGQTLEGALFAPNGDLLFCNVTDGKVMRLTPGGELSQVMEEHSFAPGGLAWHKDGRLFVAGVNQADMSGGIIALSPDGKTKETIISKESGYMPNDLVFDIDGGFYFSDFRGSATRSEGGIYHVSPDFKTITPVIPNMGQANGVALSPDGKTLWATEYAKNRLHRVNLEGATRTPLTGSKILYHFTGPAPDSMRVDEDGNVYVALVGQGRVLIFNPAGIPIGQVLLPDRHMGLNLRSTSLALHPEKAEMRIVSGNTQEASSREAMIFGAPAFAKSLPVPIK